MKQVGEKKSSFCFWVLLFIYTAIALFRLGAHEIPETAWNSTEKGKEIILDFGDVRSISGFVYFLGNYENRKFSIETVSDGTGKWEHVGNIQMSQVYQWGIERMNLQTRYLKFKTENRYTQLNELVFFDRAGQIVRPVNLLEYPELFDEEELYMTGATFQSGTVFDEPVFARTAYEYLNGIRSYEDTHPPMGKILISVGILLFGMNPFGWRFMGVVSGSAMLIVIWLFGRKLFKNPWISFWITAIFAFDFLHFTHSRLAQVDSFLVLFMLLMNYFMYLYGELLLAGQVTRKENGIKRLLGYLLGSGICMGLAIACKWSGFYGAAGLALIWLFYTGSAVRKGYLEINELIKIVGWCVISFIIVPMVIYTVSYIPYISIDPTRSYFEELILNQINMFRYHSQLKTVHPQSSEWYQWPLAAGIMTYISTYTKTAEQHVLLLGNPVFWFSGLAAVFVCIYETWNRKDRKGAMLLVMYLLPMIPWMLVPRTSFLYHYFPSLPALALMLGYWAEHAGKKGLILLSIISLLSIFAFVIFYPVLAGVEISFEHFMKLQWLPWWDFMSV